MVTQLKRIPGIPPFSSPQTRGPPMEKQKFFPPFPIFKRGKRKAKKIQKWPGGRGEISDFEESRPGRPTTLSRRAYKGKVVLVDSGDVVWSVCSRASNVLQTYEQNITQRLRDRWHQPGIAIKSS